MLAFDGEVLSRLLRKQILTFALQNCEFVYNSLDSSTMFCLRL